MKPLWFIPPPAKLRTLRLFIGAGQKANTQNGLGRRGLVVYVVVCFSSFLGAFLYA